jgi:hypothetical protein
VPFSISDVLDDFRRSQNTQSVEVRKAQDAELQKSIDEQKKAQAEYQKIEESVKKIQGKRLYIPASEIKGSGTDAQIAGGIRVQHFKDLLEQKHISIEYLNMMARQGHLNKDDLQNILAKPAQQGISTGGPQSGSTVQERQTPGSSFPGPVPTPDNVTNPLYPGMYGNIFKR